MSALVVATGRWAVDAVSAIGALFLLGLETGVSAVTGLLGFRFRWRECLEQCYLLAVESLPVIAFSLTFISLMLITELSFHMRLVLRQDSLVPAFSTVLLVRELGPVVTCLLLVSRVGAGIAAEIGTMKVTDQIDSLRLLGMDPVEYLVVPRWVGAIVATVTLSVISLAVACAGGALLASVRIGYTAWEFFNTMFVFARPTDLAACVLKALVFGTILPLVAAHHGFRCRPGSRGVGDAATAAVVHGSVLVIVADFVVTYLYYAL